MKHQHFEDRGLQLNKPGLKAVVASRREALACRFRRNRCLSVSGPLCHCQITTLAVNNFAARYGRCLTSLWHLSPLLCAEVA